MRKGTRGAVAVVSAIALLVTPALARGQEDFPPPPPSDDGCVDEWVMCISAAGAESFWVFRELQEIECAVDLAACLLDKIL